MNTSADKAYSFSLAKYKQKPVIWIKFDYDRDMIKSIRQHGARWSQTNRCWYVTDNAHFRTLFNLSQNTVGKSVLAALSVINQQILKQYIETLQLKSYSKATIKTYTNEFSQLLYLLKEMPASELSYERLRSYFLYCTNELKLSEHTLHSRINAIKFYFEQMLNRPKFMAEIPRPKKPSVLPKVFNQNEIKRIFSVTVNPKHLLMLQLCYGMGLRVSEIVNLKIADIDSGRMQVLIQSSKGKKDRYVTLPDSVLKSLRDYYQTYKPKEYLFEGQYGGQYSIRSAQLIFKSAMKKAGIRKRVGIHGLRHSYATHLLEYGTDISFIQKLLGHNNIKTTLIYTHVSKADIGKIKSPLDGLAKQKKME